MKHPDTGASVSFHTSSNGPISSSLAMFFLQQTYLNKYDLSEMVWHNTHKSLKKQSPGRVLWYYWVTKKKRLIFFKLPFTSRLFHFLKIEYTLKRVNLRKSLRKKKKRCERSTFCTVNFFCCLMLCGFGLVSQGFTGEENPHSTPFFLLTKHLFVHALGSHRNLSYLLWQMTL